MQHIKQQQAPEWCSQYFTNMLTRKEIIHHLRRKERTARKWCDFGLAASNTLRRRFVLSPAVDGAGMLTRAEIYLARLF